MTSEKAGKMERKYLFGSIAVVVIVLTSILSFLIYTSMSQDQRPHSPIIIDGDGDFAAKAKAEGWRGDGSPENPYIVSRYAINATGSAYCIYAGNTTAHFVLDDLTVTGAGKAGIRLHNVQNGRLSNITARGNMEGMCMTNCSGIAAKDCVASSNGFNGTYVLGSRDVALANVSASSNTFNGIYLEETDGASIEAGSADSNGRNGVYLMYCPDARVNGTEMSSNAWAGLVVKSSDDSVLTWVRSESNDWEGLSVWSSYRVRVADSTLLGNLKDGLYIGDSEGVEVVSNTISLNHNNGIDARICRDVDLTGNTVNSNSWQGIYLYDFYGSATANSVSSNVRSGIYVNSSSGSVALIGNACSNNDYGIFIWSSGETVANNTLSNNIHHGVYVYNATSSGNRIWNNTFHRNNGTVIAYDPLCVQAYDEGAGNWWNTTDGRGNLWSDWREPDADLDGIVDDPYNIAGAAGAKDYYPLMTA